MAKKQRQKRPKVADISSKRLISLMPADWLRWVTKLSNIQAVEVIDADFQWISRHSDALIKASDSKLGEFLVLIEVQFRNDNHMPRRMSAYASLAREKFSLPVYPVLINILPPSENTEIPEHFEEIFLGKRALQEYDVINLWEVEATLAFEQRLLLPFVPIMKGGEQKQLIQRALNELRADEQLKEMEMTLAFFASFVMQTTLIKQIMRWDMVVLQQSPWYQQILSEGVEVGLEKGIELGREEGREVGREEGIELGRQSLMRQLLRILTHHFGEVPERMKQQLDLLSIPQLETLTDTAFSVRGLDELQQHPLLADS